MKRFELSTLSLARRCSTTELHPHDGASADMKSMHHRGPLGQPNPGAVDLLGVALSLTGMTSAPIASPSQALPAALSELDASVVDLLRRHNLLRSLVEQEVVAQAIASADLSIMEAADLLSSYRQQQGMTEEAVFQAFLRQNGLSQEDLEHQLLLPRQRQHLAQAWFGHKAEARFLTRKNQLDRVVYSLLRVRDRFLAQELYLRISGGEANFADLAAEFAEGPERSTKGIVGPVPLTQAHPILAERLRTSSPGQLLEPIPIAGWWLVVRLESYAPASFDEATAAQMANELMDQWVKQETSRTMALLMTHSEQGQAA
jgi:parvulin-like peptidyl-prolyl isomerase